MTESNIGVALSSDRNQERSAGKADAQPNTDVLTLLNEGRTASLEKQRTTSLPDLELARGSGSADCHVTDGKEANLAMGNPSCATTDVANKDNYLHLVKITDSSGDQKTEFASSYNDSHKTPNWVSWQLDTDWLGPTPRKQGRSPFVPDESLPFKDKATSDEYSRTGFDRGHNMPSADRTKTVDDNNASFLMSNIAPQAPDNNRGPWEELEKFSRVLAKQGKELYIVAGNEGEKGKIGNGINVPETWFKVAVVLPQKGMGAADVTSDTQVIAVEMPNTNGIKRDDWHKYVTTIDEIEKHTGYHLLANLPKNVHDTLAVKKFSGTN